MTPIENSPLIEFLYSFSESFGSGDAGFDIAVLSLLFSFFALMFALAAFLRRLSPAPVTDEYAERNRALGGKLEKLERALNEFRTHTHRRLEQISPGAADVSGADTSEAAKESDAEGAAGLEAGDEAIEQIEPIESEPEAAPLSRRLKRTRFGLFDRLRSIFSSRPTLDPEMVQELRAQLIGADLGVRVVDSLISNVQESVGRGESIDEAAFVSLLKGSVRHILNRDADSSAVISGNKRDGIPCIVMVVGVNGVGKTTTVAKLSQSWKNAGAKVLMVAADTFRAAAVDQLTVWGDRLGIPVVSGAPDAKPATVVYDAMQRAQSEDFDVIVIDTAGRLHTKINLMQELAGVKNAIQRHFAAAPHEVLLVVDGSTGQNALSQAREFNDAVQLSGIVITKLDGTPKGGIVVAIKDELNLPVRYIGVGESAQDLRPFVADEFIEALFDTTDLSLASANSSDTGGPGMSAHGEQRRRRRAA